jgi:hypothetical protein
MLGEDLTSNVSVVCEVTAVHRGSHGSRSPARVHTVAAIARADVLAGCHLLTSATVGTAAVEPCVCRPGSSAGAYVSASSKNCDLSV